MARSRGRNILAEAPKEEVRRAVRVTRGTASKLNQYLRLLRRGERFDFFMGRNHLVIHDTEMTGTNSKKVRQAL